MAVSAVTGACDGIHGWLLADLAGVALAKEREP